MSVLPLGKDITAYSVALALRNGLQVDIRLKCATAAAAQTLRAEMMRKQPAAAAGVHVTVVMMGNSLKLGLSVSERDLATASQAALSGAAGQQLSGIGAALANTQSKAMIASGEQGGSATVRTQANGSLIRNIQGGELEPAPAKTPADAAADGHKPQ